MGNFASVFIQTSFNNRAVCLNCCVGGGTFWVARPKRSVILCGGQNV